MPQCVRPVRRFLQRQGEKALTAVSSSVSHLVRGNLPARPMPFALQTPPRAHSPPGRRASGGRGPGAPGRNFIGPRARTAATAAVAGASKERYAAPFEPAYFLLYLTSPKV